MVKLVFYVSAIFGYANYSHAAFIPTLFNTGIGNDGRPLAAGSIDPHYRLVTNPNGIGTENYVTLLDRFPGGYWFANNSASQWISPQQTYGELQGDAPNSTFVFRTTFDLSGYDPKSASVAVRWAVDNDGIDVLLNGSSVNHQTAMISYYAGFSTFDLNSGFRTGQNTLDFIVYNGPNGVSTGPPGNPVGLRVELSGNATLVPLPPTWSLAFLICLLFATQQRINGFKYA